MAQAPVQGMVSGQVRQEMRGNCLLISLDRPPVNAISRAMRVELAALIAAAAVDPAVASLVIRGEGKGFSAGADVTEFGGKGQAIDLGQLCQAIESLGKPVVAALHGTVLGGGLEIALACHHRIATAQAWLGLPEVNLGLLPGAGGTQRLPRLIGAAQALRMMLTGAPVAAAEALAMGLVDLVVETDLSDAACQLAQTAALRRSCDASAGFTDPRGFQEAIAAARARLKDQPLPAPQRIVDCVEAASLLSFSQGLDYESAAFADLVQSLQSLGLRHAFFAERRAAAAPVAVAALPAKRYATLGVWGAATAPDFVVQALAGGLRVLLADPSREALVDGLEQIADLQGLAVAEGRMTDAARDADWARLQPIAKAEDLIGLDLILVGPGLAPLPPQVPLDGVIRLGGLPKTARAAVAISVPPRKGGLAEIAASSDAPAAQIAAALALARGFGWRVVFAGPGGPIERRLRQALAAGIAHLETEGEPSALIAAALAAYGLGGRPVAVAMPKGGEAVVQICLDVIANQGAMLLADGVARRPGDIDAVAIHCGLMPRWTGGPMYQADLRGILLLRSDLRARAGRAGAAFVPSPLLDQLIADGQNFAALNRG